MALGGLSRLCVFVCGHGTYLCFENESVHSQGILLPLIRIDPTI